MRVHARNPRLMLETDFDNKVIICWYFMPGWNNFWDWFIVTSWDLQVGEVVRPRRLLGYAEYRYEELYLRAEQPEITFPSLAKELIIYLDATKEPHKNRGKRSDIIIHNGAF